MGRCCYGLATYGAIKASTLYFGCFEVLREMKGAMGSKVLRFDVALGSRTLAQWTGKSLGKVLSDVEIVAIADRSGIAL